MFRYLQFSLTILLQALENEGEKPDEYGFEASLPVSAKAEPVETPRMSSDMSCHLCICFIMVFQLPIDLYTPCLNKKIFFC